MTKAGEWLHLLPEFCSSILGQESEPITLLLGAGAMSSSGGPTTTSVAEAIYRENRRDIARVVDVFKGTVRISEKSKRDAIEPLFANTSPYIGYQLLAALGRSRPVTVISLNWDDSVLKACRQLGIPCIPFDLGDSVAEIQQARDDASSNGSGVVVIHVHGHLGTEQHPARYPLRFSLLETLKLEPEQFSLLAECFDSSTLVVGASLCAGREVDTAQLIEALGGSGGNRNQMEIKPLWVAVREVNGEGPDAIIHSVLRARQSSSNILQGPDVDFDRIMWALRSADARYTWEEIQGNHSQIRLLSEPDLILPAPELLRPYLSEPPPVLILPGRGRQGKSTVAHIAAHWLSLLAADTPRVRTFRTKQSAEAIGALEQGEIIVIDDPFGESDYRASPQVFDQLRTLKCGFGQIIVATRFESYDRACRDAEYTDMPAVLSSASAWWSQIDLEHYGQWFAPSVAVQVRDDPVSLNTPFRVTQAAARGGSWHVGEGELAETTRWLAEELKHHMPHALLVLLVRLQDFHEPLPRHELELTAGCISSGHDVAAIGGILRVVRVEEEHLRVSHPEDIEAVDQVIVQHRDIVDATLEGVLDRAPWVLDAISAWEAVVGSTDLVPPKEIEDSVLFEWTFELVQRAAASSADDAIALLESARQRAPDTWAFREVVFAAVCMWRAISDHGHARDFLKQVIKDRRHRGTYALVEALLRVRYDTDFELTAEALNAISTLARTGKAHEELILIFDALLWRSLAVSDQTRRQVFERLLGAAHDSERMRAGFAAAAAYHRSGLDALLAERLENPLQWTSAARGHPDVVVWHLQWHLAHQARIHAIVTRQSFLTPDSDEIRYLGRSRCEESEMLEDDQSRALQALIEELSSSVVHAGWGVHLSIHINSVAGALDAKELTSVVRRIKKADTGLAMCALYTPREPLEAPIRDYLRSPAGRGELLRVLGAGFEFEDVNICSPRFRLTASGWGVRERWHIPDEGLGEALGLPLDNSQAALEILADHTDEAMEVGAHARGLKVISSHYARGDTAPLERMPARAPEGEGRDGDVSLLAIVLAEVSRILAPDE